MIIKRISFRDWADDSGFYESSRACTRSRECGVADSINTLGSELRQERRGAHGRSQRGSSCGLNYFDCRLRLGFSAFTDLRIALLSWSNSSDILRSVLLCRSMRLARSMMIRRLSSAIRRVPLQERAFGRPRPASAPSATSAPRCNSSPTRFPNLCSDAHRPG